MTGKHPNAFRKADTSAYPLLEDAMAKGFIDSMEEYPVDGFAGHEAANRGRLSVGRGGKHFNVAVPCWIVDAEGKPCRYDCKDPAAPHGLRFRLHSKNIAREFIAGKAKGDPSNLKYNPFAKQRGKVDDNGKAVR